MDLFDDLLAEETPAYDPAEERKAFIARMLAEGFCVVAPKANELQVDIDTDEQYAIFEKAAHAYGSNEMPLTYEEHPSRSGLPRRHITITLPFDVTPWQRIAMQGAFGSDPMRELLSCVRILRGDDRPTLFVEAK